MCFFISSKYWEQRVLNFMRDPKLAHILVHIRLISFVHTK